MISNNEARLFFTASKSPGYSYIATILMTLFTFITVLILSNILIGIVCNSYDKAIEVGDREFWVNRLHVVNEIGRVFDLLRKIFFMPKKSKKSFLLMKPLTSIWSENEKDKFDRARIMWDLFLVGFEDPKSNFNKRLKIVGRCKSVGLSMFVEKNLKSQHAQPVITRIIGIIVLPIWLLLGFVSLGILWPPQIRSFFLCEKIIDSHSQGDFSSMDTGVDSSSSLAIVRSEVTAMKCTLETTEIDIIKLKKEVKGIGENVTKMEESIMKIKEDMVTIISLLSVEHTQ